MFLKAEAANTPFIDMGKLEKLAASSGNDVIGLLEDIDHALVFLVNAAAGADIEWCGEFTSSAAFSGIAFMVFDMMNEARLARAKHRHPSVRDTSLTPADVGHLCCIAHTIDAVRGELAAHMTLINLKRANTD